MTSQPSSDLVVQSENGPSAPSAPRRIRLLSDTLIDRIAAGEVIERPASVVKELVENALDAGATRIDVTLTSREGWSITVTDDGEGMGSEDLVMAFQRHATSKITGLDDLDRLSTLGFRGEALPSIAAVSRVCARSARAGASEGTEVSIDGGRIERSAPCAARPGTTMEIMDLFAHTPARRKFLKSVSTELSHACAVVQQHALGHPDVGFFLSHEERAIVEYPAVETMADRLAQIYGRALVEERALPLAGRRGPIEVWGWCSRPGIERATRQGQEWFVNGRPVRHPLFLRAVDHAYAGRLMTGRHPVVVGFLALPPSEVDVNVHPAKREVRFSRADDVYRVLFETLTEALTHHDATGGTASTSIPSPAIGTDTPADTGWNDRVEESSPPYAMPQQDAPRAPSLALGPMVRCLGQFDQTYLVAEVDGVLRVIDQHAAHERVMYERLVKDYAGSNALSQPLLVPASADYPPDQAIAIAERLELLRGVGVDIEPFGGSTFLVRAIPAVIAGSDWRAVIWEMVDALISDEVMESPDPPHRLLATVACHAAIKAHQRLDDDAMRALVRDWIATPRNATCPHGRPVALTWAPADLERALGRRA